MQMALMTSRRCRPDVAGATQDRRGSVVLSNVGSQTKQVIVRPGDGCVATCEDGARVRAARTGDVSMDNANLNLIERARTVFAERCVCRLEDGRISVIKDGPTQCMTFLERNALGAHGSGGKPGLEAAFDRESQRQALIRSNSVR